jgi:predicted DNA-binding transcriptional regulator AlpA
MQTSQGSQHVGPSDDAAKGPFLGAQETLDTRNSQRGATAGQSRPKRLLRIEHVLERVPVSRSQLYNMIAARKFPKQVHAGGGQAAFWVESEIDEWIQSQIDAERRAA